MKGRAHAVNARLGWVWIAAVVVGSSSLQALAQAPGGTPPAAAAAKPAIATVGTERISREEWERRSQMAIGEFSRRNANAELPPQMRDLIRRQVLEGQIRFAMLAQEARRTGVLGTPLEAEAVLKEDPFFNPGGRFDESRFLAVKTTQTASFNAAIQSLRAQIGARKLNERLEAKYRPTDGDTRAAASRALTRATIEHLSLRTADFVGTYPEPRESDVLAWYRSHAADYQRPDRATLTVAFVNSPGLSDSIRALPNGTENWTKRMKVLADSILGEVARGATLEQAAGFLGPRPNTVVTSDNYPGYWQASAAQNALLFDPKNVGKVIPQALPSVEGWLVVRVDAVVPAHVAPLAEVAREIRGVLRKDRRLNHETYELRNYYGQVRDSLAAPGWRVRWALADTATQKVAPPTDAELEAWFRGHLADYSTFDAKAGTIVSRSLAEVKDEVRARWLGERRRAMARQQADALFKTWVAGRRDAALEAATRTRETAALVWGALPDSSREGRVLADSLWAADEPHGPGMAPAGRGWVVWAITGREARTVPTFEQARDLVARRFEIARQVEEEAGGQRLWAADPDQFGGGNVVHFGRFTVPEMPVLDVKLTRAEVERYQREHLDRFSAPELVTARHILIEPADNSLQADRAARRRADEILQRAKAGEDFGKLAKEYSDDAATKDKGGDLGTFGRGAMVDAFERAAFALRSAEFVNQPVRTPLGWHVIYCVEHVPAVVHPLEWVYTLVAAEAAADKADRLAKERSDSLLRFLKSPAGARRVAEQLGYPTYTFTKKVGEESPATLTKPYYEALDRTASGRVVNETFHIKGQGYWVSWVDSITPPRRPSWEEARAAAVQLYRRGAGQRALDAKRAELDTLLASGWSLDSVATLWGGIERIADASPGRGLPGMSGAATLDSLVFGGAKPPALAVGAVSPWVAFPNGWSRVRVPVRSEPPAEVLSARVENDRAAAIERGLQGYFEELRQRYPVRILDARMREMSTAAPPPPTPARP